MVGRCSIWGQERRKRINKCGDTDQREFVSREKPESMALIEIKSLEGQQNGKGEISKCMSAVITTTLLQQKKITGLILLIKMMIKLTRAAVTEI